MKGAVRPELGIRIEEAYTDADRTTALAAEVFAAALRCRRVEVFLFDAASRELSLKKILHDGVIFDGEEEFSAAENPALLPLIEGRRDTLLSVRPRSGFWGALRSEGELQGLVWASGRRNAFSLRDQRAFRQLAPAVADSLHKNRLHVRGQKRDAALNTFADITNILAGTRYLSDMLKRFLRAVFHNFHFDLIRIYLVNERTGTLDGVVSGDFLGRIRDLRRESFPLKRGLNPLVDMALSRRGPPVQEFHETGLNIALRSKGRTVGVLSVNNFFSHCRITEEERKALISLSGQVAMTIERVSLFEQVERLSVTDGMTGLYLFRHLRARYEAEASRSKRLRRPLSLILIDLDKFKSVNDTHGHQVGDQVLQAVAKAIRQSLRAKDIAARYGGDEFLVMLPRTGRADSTLVAERLRASIRSLAVPLPGGGVLGVSVSIGVSTDPGRGWSITAMFQKADAALYRTKKAGRDGVTHA